MRRIQKPLFATLAAGALLATTSCAASSAGAAADGPSVDYQASIDEWHAAFADVEPITLHTQVLYPDGDLNNQMYLDYYAAVEEYSDGKITFDVAYASSIAPYAEVFDAVVDGRLDIGISSPSFMPADFPAYSAWIDLGGALGPKGAFPGVLNTYSWTAEAMMANGQVVDEFADYGLKLLHPFTYAGYDQGIVCTQQLRTLDDFRGKSILVSAPSQAQLAEAIGLTPVSLPFSDWFDALQRGVADCASNTLTASQSLGLFDVAPHVTLDEEVFFGNLGTGALVINQGVWETLPLVSQQLLFDMLPEVTDASIKQTNFQRILDSLTQLDATPNSSLNEFDPAVRAALQDVLQGTLESTAQAGALDYDRDELETFTQQLIAKWESEIDAYGYPTLTYSELLDKWESSAVNLDEWNTRFFEEVLLPHRP